MAGEYVEICNMPDVKNCYGEKQKQGKRNGAVHQKKKRQRVDLINKIRNKRSYNQYHRNTILREYYKQLYANKLNDLKELTKFLGAYNLPRLDQEGLNIKSKQTNYQK